MTLEEDLKNHLDSFECNTVIINKGNEMLLSDVINAFISENYIPKSEVEKMLDAIYADRNILPRNQAERFITH